MNSLLASVGVSAPLLMGVLLWNVAGPGPSVHAADAPTPLTTVEDQRGESGDPGKVEERGLSRVPMPGRMAPGERVFKPGGTYSALTKAECTSLRCSVVTDTGCPNVGGLTERCLCGGKGPGVCIDEVK